MIQGSRVVMGAILFAILIIPNFNLSCSNHEVYNEEDDVHSLIKKLKDDDGVTRINAALELKWFGPDGVDAVPALLKALNDEKQWVRENAVDALREIGPYAGEYKTAVIEALVKTIEENEDSLVDQAFYAIVKMGSEAVPYLMKLMEHENINVRTRAIGVVLEICKRDMQPILRALNELDLDFGNQDLQGALYFMFSMIDGYSAKKAFMEVIKSVTGEEWLSSSATELIKEWTDPTDLNALIKELENDDPIIREHAIQAIGGFGPDASPALPSLKNFLDRGDGEIPRVLFFTFANIGIKAIPVLTEALNSDDDKVRIFAMGSLGDIGPDAKDAIPALREMLQDEETEIRLYAVFNLADIGKEAVPAIVEAIDDEDNEIRIAAINMLDNMGPDAADAASALTVLISNDNEDPLITGEAIQALGSIGYAAEEALPALRKYLDAGDGEPLHEDHTRLAIRKIEYSLRASTKSAKGS